MGLRTSRQFQRWARGILRVTLNAALAVSIAFALHTLMRGKSKSWNGDGTGLKLPAHDSVEPLRPIEVAESQQHPVENATLWQVMLQDPTLQSFVSLNMPFSDIKDRLDNASEIFTIYAPINSAFEGPLRNPVDAPGFYYKFLSLNHMGPKNISYEELKASTTVENFINHDIFFKNLQRISTQGKNGEMTLNHVANYVGQPLQAINGFVHHIDSLLYLPDAVSDLLRSDVDLQMFQSGLIDTDIAVIINDTQSHLTQTIFAPTNEAFKNLGAKANKFLFSPLGKTYLTALLQYHVIMNSTLFTDVYFKPNNSGQVNMNTSSEAVQLPTLLPHRYLTASIVKNHHRQTLLINDEVVVDHPDLILMDGVVHKIDRVLLPPSLAQGDSNEGSHKGEGSIGSFASWPWLWRKHGSKIGVMELMDRLQPYLVDEN
ncbi:hypothetical protein MMC22_004172 [Lobaria immixta]|nr:hypothetical protein [Lobaria immixta]